MDERIQIGVDVEYFGFARTFFDCCAAVGFIEE